MRDLAIAAGIVGGSTVLGSIIGFRFEKLSTKLNHLLLSFGAGVMLAAAILGLILPSLGIRDMLSIFVSIFGILAGAISLSLMDRPIATLYRRLGAIHCSKGVYRGLLFVIAIAIHNLPEGIAAGVGFGGDGTQAMLIAGSIALQNIPEGMVIITPMISAGIARKKALRLAFGTAAIEILGMIIGYTAVSLSAAILPFALAFAGGTMLYVILDEMIPQTQGASEKREATYAVLFGFCTMLWFDTLL